MTATKYPAGFPVPNPTKSYWQTPLHRLADHRTTTDLPSKAEYVIVGSGISGTSIAYKLLSSQPSASIVILEARQASSGASGRNGGHCRSGRYLSFSDDVRKFGQEDALKMEKLEENNVHNVGAFIREHGIEADLREVETVDMFVDPKQLAEALAALEARRRVAEKLGDDEAKAVFTKHRVWSEKATREELLIPDGVGAISFPAFVLNPYKLVCALLEKLIDKGLNLQTNTPVSEIEKGVGKKRWRVRTQRGHIDADNVILATNAYTAALYPPLGNYIIPTRGQVSAIRPGSKMAGNKVLERSCQLVSDNISPYFQSRAERFSGGGDVIIGGARTLSEDGQQPVFDDSTIHRRISEYQTKEAMLQAFGRAAWGEDGPVVMEWTGIMGYSANQQPYVGQAPGREGLWLSVGFHGHGMALTWQAAEALVGLINGKDEEVHKWLPECWRVERILRDE